MFSNRTRASRAIRQAEALRQYMRVNNEWVKQHDESGKCFSTCIFYDTFPGMCRDMRQITLRQQDLVAQNLHRRAAL